MIKQENKEKKWNDFMFTRQFQAVMMFVKIFAMLTLIFIAWIVFTNIEAVKFLNLDACAYCMEKTGAQCHILRYP